MRLLSFDTSSSLLSVAIAEDGRILAEANLASDTGAKADRQQSVSLLVPTVDRLTKEAGLKKEDLQAIVVGIGPGGFTGVRVAVVTGRTLAQALKLPLVGINSLEVASYGQPSAVGALVIKEASKTHCFVAHYGRVAYDQDFYDLEALIAPKYLSFEDFGEQFGAAISAPEPGKNEARQFYVEKSIAGRFDQLSSGMMEAPVVNNIAACQAKIAHVRLSLKAVEGQDLVTNFPYRLVQPLYLRGASVTLKKGDVIERVEAH